MIVRILAFALALAFGIGPLAAEDKIVNNPGLRAAFAIDNPNFPNTSHRYHAAQQLADMCSAGQRLCVCPAVGGLQDTSACCFIRSGCSCCPANGNTINLALCAPGCP
jgi:hypothetical protein